VSNYKDRISAALAIGNEGINNADPDWRIPYYMAADYFLELKDDKNALSRLRPSILAEFRHQVERAAENGRSLGNDP
jgi:hypothetical protein